MGIARGVGRAVKALRRKSSNRLMGNRNKQGDFITVDQQIEDVQKELEDLITKKREVYGELEREHRAEDGPQPDDLSGEEIGDIFNSSLEADKDVASKLEEIEELVQKSIDQEIEKTKLDISNLRSDDDNYLRKLQGLQDKVEDFKMEKDHQQAKLDDLDIGHFQSIITPSQKIRMKRSLGNYDTVPERELPRSKRLDPFDDPDFPDNDVPF